MFNKQLKANIKAMDLEIAKLTEELASCTNEEYELQLQKIEDLTKVRERLSNNKVSESYSKEVVTGLFGLAGMVLVLKYEKTDVVTSKAYSMATRLIRGF